MDATYQRTIEELITRYSFHPEMRDLYVEGVRDEFFFRWFFATQRAANAKVYKIDSVFVPKEIVDAFSVTEGGNKGRVIALSLALEDNLLNHANGVKCVVDKDLADFGFPVPKSRYLTVTDDCCLECYAFKRSVISKFFSLYLGRPLHEAYVSSMMSVLRFVFLTRIAKRRLASDAPWFNDFPRCCTFKGGQISLDTEALINRVVNASARKIKAEKLLEVIAELERGVQGCGTVMMHGHDAIRLLSWLAKELKVSQKIADSEPLGRALFAAVDPHEISDMPLFSALVAWAVT